MRSSTVAVLASSTLGAFLLFIGISFPYSSFGIISHSVFVVSVSLSFPMVAYGVADYLRYRRVRNAEKKLPDLLRDLSNYTSFGVPLSEAFTRIGGNNYDSLNPGVRKVSGLVSAGVNFNEAVSMLGEGLHSSKIAMVSKILEKSNESGSNTSDVIWILSEYTTRSELLKDAREGEMKNYDRVMIISFAVFLFVILFLDIRFLNVILSHSIVTGSFISGKITSRSIETAFSAGVVAQAFAIGMISGILRDIRITSGILLTGLLIGATSAIFLAVGVY